jgi:hypothetical protein
MVTINKLPANISLPWHLAYFICYHINSGLLLLCMYEDGNVEIEQALQCLDNAYEDDMLMECR